MKLAEIVVTPETSDATIATVTDAATRCGKHPIVVKDNPMQWGFVANRVYFAMVARGATCRRRGHRDPRRGRPADDGLLPLAERALRHGHGRRLRLDLTELGRH